MSTLADGTRADVDACVDLWMSALAQRDGRVPVSGTAERCRAKLESDRVAWSVLRAADSAVEAFALVTAPGTGRDEDPADAAYLSLLAVAPGLQGGGRGGRLLDDVQERAAAAGYGALVLHVLIDNEAAIALYRSRGWVEVGERFHHALYEHLCGTFLRRS